MNHINSDVHGAIMAGIGLILFAIAIVVVCRSK